MEKNEEKFTYPKAVGFTLGWGFISFLMMLFCFPFLGLAACIMSGIPDTFTNVTCVNGLIGLLIAMVFFLALCLEEKQQQTRKQELTIS